MTPLIALRIIAGLEDPFAYREYINHPLRDDSAEGLWTWRRRVNDIVKEYACQYIAGRLMGGL